MSTNYTCPQGTQDLVHFNNPFYDSFSEVNIASQLCLLLGAIYRTALASAEWNTDANLCAVLECSSDLLMRSSVKGSLRTFSASTYVTSLSMSVDCAPLKKFQCQKSSNGTGCCSHVARGSCWTPIPLRIQDQSLHSWCTHCTLLMRFAPEERKKNHLAEISSQ